MTLTVLSAMPKVANQQSLDLAEELLERVKSGEVQEIAIAMVYTAGGTGYRRSGSDSIQKLIGAVAIMQHNLLLDTDEFTT